MHALHTGFRGGETVSYSQTFYPEPGPAAAGPRRSAPGRALGPAERIHAPRTNALPDAPTAPPRERRWPRAFALCTLLSAAAGVLYVALHVLVGQEILATSIVIGVLAGAGMRLGGLEDRWSVAFAATAIAMVAWAVASAVGDALVRALAPEVSLRSAFEGSVGTPAAIVGVHASEPLLVPIAALLVTSGAVAATATFTRSRARRRPARGA